jgi:hypothetical protein
MLAHLWPLALLALALLTLPACTIGPTVETRYVIVHPGQPVRILQGVTVTGERLDGGGPATLDIGGWIAMPPDHWAIIAGLIRKDHPDVLAPAAPVATH